MTTTDRMQRRAVVMLAAFAAIAAGVVLLTHRDQPIPTDLAEGTYASSTCGTVSVKGDKLVSEGMSVRYEYRRRKTDIAILPDRYVYIDRTAANGRCRVLSDGSRTPLALQLSAGTPSSSIEIDDNQGNGVHFDRIR